MRLGRRALVLPGLAVVAASTDAISYLGLGHVFTGNMTGNTALLGIGIAAGRTGAVLRSTAALCAFVLGAIAGNLFIWRRRLLASCLVVELIPVATWLGYRFHHGDHYQSGRRPHGKGSWKGASPAGRL